MSVRTRLSHHMAHKAVLARFAAAVDAFEGGEVPRYLLEMEAQLKVRVGVCGDLRCLCVCAWMCLPYLSVRVRVCVYVCVYMRLCCVCCACAVCVSKSARPCCTDSVACNRLQDVIVLMKLVYITAELTNNTRDDLKFARACAARSYSVRGCVQPATVWQAAAAHACHAAGEDDPQDR
jgi:hypothetical protein